MVTRTVQNSLSGIALIVVNALLQVVTIPLMLHTLGAEGYGVFALVGTVGLFGYFINIGFHLSIVKFVGEQGTGIDSDRDILMSLSAVTVLTVIATAILLMLNEQVLTVVLGLSLRSVDTGVVQFLNSIVFTNALLFIGQVPAAVIDVQKRIYINNYLQILFVVANRSLVIAVLMSGGGFSEMALVYYGTSAVWFVLLVSAFLRTWTFTSIDRWYADGRSRLKKHYSYGVKIYLTSIAGFFYEPFAKILISRFIGLPEVGVFDIAFKVKTLFWGIIEKGLYPIVPKIASAGAEEARTIINWLSRKMLLAAMPLSVLLYVLIEPAMILWLGSGHDMVIAAVRVLIVVHIFTASMIPIYAYLMMKDHAGKAMTVQFLNALLGMVYFFPLSAAFGFTGSVIAFAGAVLTTGGILVWWQWSLVHSNIFRSPKEYGVAAVIACTVAAAAWAVSLLGLGTLTGMGVMLIAGTVLTGVLSVMTSLFTLEDVRIILRRAPFPQSV